MKWTNGTIGDLVALQRGFDLTDLERHEGTVPVIGSAGPNGFHNEARARSPGVTIGRSGGSIGKVTFVGQDFWPHNTCIFVTDFKGNDPRFVAYRLQTIDLARLNSGAAQPSLNRNFVYGVRIQYPRPAEQRRISDIFCAYDDLLENNRRRMATMEAARQLYREWFVRLRFPGYEHTCIVDGVPEGWERRTLGECDALKRGHDFPESQRVEGTIPVVSSSGITGFHNQKKADGPGTVTGRYGTLGQVYFIDEDYWPHNTALYVADFKGNNPCVLFYFLTHTLESAQSNNAAVPGLNRNVLHTLKLLWPSVSLRNQFDAFLEPLLRHIGMLRRMNDKLRAARDVLLPRLMSGEVAV